MTHKVLLIVLFAVFQVIFLYEKLQGQKIVINEFMSDNEATIMDKDGDYSDWIELYNNSEFPVNLFQYHLSDNSNILNKWTFPEIVIPPQGFLVVFASGKDIYNPEELHTNFSIAAEGEAIFLSNNNGELIDQTDAIMLWEDESLGRYPDGSENWLKSSITTAGYSNNTVNHLLFSAEEGFYSAPFILSIKSLTGDTVYFTTDGSVPDVSSHVFPDSMLMLYRYNDPNYFADIPNTPSQDLLSYKAWESPDTLIHKANIIRSASYRNGIRTSRIYTHTYLIDSLIFNKYQLPVISLVTDEKNLFDPDSGIYVPGKHFDPENPEWSGNYFNTGDEWERPVSISYFERDGLPGFSLDGGIRIHGYKSRQASQKSLRLYTRKEYGRKSFNYPLLPQRQVTDYRRIVLRTTMGDWFANTLIRDVLAHELSRDLDLEYQDYQPVVVYLNGEYWGIYTIRDRLDERYIEYLYGIDKDQVDLINGNYLDVEAGSNEHFVRLAEFIESNDLSQNDNYEFVTTQIDISNFIDYQISEMFFANLDWPINNQRLWRPQTHDGKWRWIFFDVDAGFSDPAFSMLHHSLVENMGPDWQNMPVSTFLFDNLLKNENFLNLFLDRYAEVLREEFVLDKMLEKLDMIMELYRQDLPDHIARWNFPVDMETWENDIRNQIIPFLENRPCAVEKNVSDFFNISDFGFTCSTSADTPILIPGELVVAPNPSKGSFFILNNSPELTLENLVLTDINGRIMYSEENIYLQNGIRKYFNMGGLPAGIYFLKYHNRNFSETKRIVIIP
jgi:hypothetical protein